MVIRKAAPLPAEKAASKEPLRPLPNMAYSGSLKSAPNAWRSSTAWNTRRDRVTSGAFSVKTILPNKVIMTSSQGRSCFHFRKANRMGWL